MTLNPNLPLSSGSILISNKPSDARSSFRAEGVGTREVRGRKRRGRERRRRRKRRGKEKERKGEEGRGGEGREEGRER